MVGRAHRPRQNEIDASIARAADVEMLYDRPYEGQAARSRRWSFTVEPVAASRRAGRRGRTHRPHRRGCGRTLKRLHKVMPPTDFADMVLEHLKSAGVHQSERRDTIRFTALNPLAGRICRRRGRFMEGETEATRGDLHRAGIGTLTRVDPPPPPARALDARFDVLIACAFAFDAHASKQTKLGRCCRS